MNTVQDLCTRIMSTPVITEFPADALLAEGNFCSVNIHCQWLWEIHSFIHSFRSLSYDGSMTSSKASSPQSEV